jgi:hypothetical protein
MTIKLFKLFYTFFTTLSKKDLLRKIHSFRYEGLLGINPKIFHLANALLTNPIQDCFTHPQDPEIPYTTNRLESYFTHLKAKLLRCRLHRRNLLRNPLRRHRNFRHLHRQNFRL